MRIICMRILQCNFLFLILVANYVQIIISNLFSIVPGQCTNGAVRLRSSYTPMEGRVEVCADGIWQMVCHSQWSQADGNVVCRQLGYGEFGNRVRFASFYGHSDNGFLFGNVRCSGFEDRIVDCPVNANAQCTVLQAAGVQCSNKSKYGATVYCGNILMVCMVKFCWVIQLNFNGSSN